MLLTLAQTDCALGDVPANVSATRALLEGRSGDELVLFPELSLTGYAVGSVDESCARPLATAVEAVPPGASAIVGLVEAGPVHAHNTAVWVSDGAVAVAQRKLYLPTYGPFEERKHFTPGSSLRAFDTPLGRVATLICFDAWQPQLAFLAVQDGAHILLAPSASYGSTPGATGDWHAITHLYARLFGVWVAFVNRVGSDPGGSFWGGSHLVDPWGTVVAEVVGAAPGTVSAEIDPTAVARRRREAPLVKDARLGVVHRELERLMAAGGDV